MKTNANILVGLLLCAACGFSARASYREHGTNLISSMKWPARLVELVNSPARIAGHSLNWISEFQFKSDVETLNKLLEHYASVPGFAHHVYLLSAMDPLSQEADFELQILDYGELSVSLKIFTGGKAQLRDLKVPLSVTVEMLPAVGQPIRSSEAEVKARAINENEMNALVKEHKRKRDEARQASEKR